MFIAYANDQQRARVLDLSERLRRDGIDARIDRYAAPPPEGWAIWYSREILSATSIITIWTEAYRQRFDRQARDPARVVDPGLRLLQDELREKGPDRSRIVPVVLTQGDQQYIPSALDDVTPYCTETDYDKLQRLLRSLDARSLNRPDVSKLPKMHIQSQGADFDAQAIATVTSQGLIETKRVLVVAVNRSDMPWLALGREIREITTAMRSSKHLKFDVHVLWAATERDVRHALLKDKPHILHFCGHGAAAGPVLEGFTIDGSDLDARAFRDWLAITAGGGDLEVALLNFCDNQETLDALSGVAPIIIGPIRSITDERAIGFSVAFYTTLAAGGTASLAYHLGRSLVETSPTGRPSSRPEPGAGPTSQPVAAVSHLAVSREVLAVVPDEPVSPSDEYGIRCRSGNELPSFHGPQRSMPQTIAFFASEPRGWNRIRLDLELRGIQNAVAPCIHHWHANFHLEQLWATRPIDFLSAMLSTCPAIVHISGHGIDGEFVFEYDECPEGVVMSRRGLARALTVFREHVSCALLMFDESIHVAHMVEDVFDCVIGVQGMVPDDAFVQFSEKFYEIVDDGRSYRTAFEAGRTFRLTNPCHRDAFVGLGRRLDATAIIGGDRSSSSTNDSKPR